MIGSIRTGPHLGSAWRNAIRAQISNESWSESTGWNVSALDLVDELEAGDTLVCGTDFDNDICKFTTAARLLLEYLAVLVTLRDGLLVVDLRSTLVDLHAEFAAETVHDDIQMKLTHTADDRLASLGIGFDGEGRVFFGQLTEGDSQLVEVSLGLGLDRQTDHGIGEGDRLEHHGMILVTDGIACTQLLETHCCANVASLDEVDGVLLVGVHLVKPGNTLLLAGACVQDIGARIEAARICPQERKPSDERIGGNLKYQRAERFGCLGLALDLCICAEVCSLHVALVKRGRKVADNRVEKELYTLVLEGGTAAGGHDRHIDGGLAQRGDYLIL